MTCAFEDTEASAGPADPQRRLDAPHSNVGRPILAPPRELCRRARTKLDRPVRCVTEVERRTVAILRFNSERQKRGGTREGGR